MSVENFGWWVDFEGRDSPSPQARASNKSVIATVVSELNRILGECSRKGEIFTEHVENAVRDARLKGWARCVDWEMRMAYGITLKQWQTGKVPSGKIDQFIHDSIRSGNLRFVHRL